MISKHSIASSASEQPLTIEEPLTSPISGQQLTSPCTIKHTPTDVALDTVRQDITIGRYASTGNKQTAVGEDQTLSVPLKDAVASTMLPYTTVEGIWKKAT